MCCFAAYENDPGVGSNDKKDVPENKSMSDRQIRMDLGMIIEEDRTTTDHVNRERKTKMINFEEELKNFKPSLEVEEAEQAIYNHELTDMTDVLQEMVQELKKKM